MFLGFLYVKSITTQLIVNNWYFSSIIVDWIWPRKLETRIMRSMSGPEGQPDPDWTQLWTLGALPTPKSGWCYFLDFSLNQKLDTFFGQASPNLDPEGPPHPSFEPWGPTPPESTLIVDPEGPTHPKNWVPFGGSSAWTRNWNHSEVNPTQFLNPRAHPNPIWPWVPHLTWLNPMR